MPPTTQPSTASVQNGGRAWSSGGRRACHRSTRRDCSMWEDAPDGRRVVCAPYVRRTSSSSFAAPTRRSRRGLCQRTAYPGHVYVISRRIILVRSICTDDIGHQHRPCTGTCTARGSPGSRRTTRSAGRPGNCRSRHARAEWLRWARIASTPWTQPLRTSRRRLARLATHDADKYDATTARCWPVGAIARRRPGDDHRSFAFQHAWPRRRRGAKPLPPSWPYPPLTPASAVLS